MMNKSHQKKRKKLALKFNSEIRVSNAKLELLIHLKKVVFY